MHSQPFIIRTSCDVIITFFVSVNIHTIANNFPPCRAKYMKIPKNVYIDDTKEEHIINNKLDDSFLYCYWNVMIENMFGASL